MFKTLLSTVLGFVTGGSTTVYLIAGALLLGAYGGYAVTDNHYKAKLAEVNQKAFDHTTAVIEQQAVISQNTQKEKDELQTRYDGVVSMLRGVHNSSVSTNSNTSFTIPSKGLRLLEPDAEVLIGFARQCESTEIERNDVIQKYNALMVK
jgi:hypothetical protein